MVITQSSRPSRGEFAGPVTTPNDNGLGQLISRLRAIVVALPGHLPNPADGVAWVNLDDALSALHRALIALGEMDRAVSATDGAVGDRTTTRVSSPEELVALQQGGVQ